MAEHESIPSCADPNVLACVTCSEEADRCVPWPCEHAPTDSATTLSRHMQQSGEYWPDTTVGGSEPTP